MHGLAQIRTSVTGWSWYWEGLHFLCTSSRRQDSIASKSWSPAHCRHSNFQSHLISRKERRRMCSSILGPSLRRQRRGVGAKGAVLARSSKLVLVGLRTSDRVLYDVGTCCEAPLARSREDIKTPSHRCFRPLPQKQVRNI